MSSFTRRFALGALTALGWVTMAHAQLMTTGVGNQGGAAPSGPQNAAMAGGFPYPSFLNTAAAAKSANVGNVYVNRLT